MGRRSDLNDLDFVRRVVELLARSGIDTWVFGGWAEELQGAIPPRPHGDLDLLYPAAGFDAVDALLGGLRLREIVAKRFRHKRAFVFDGVMVELFLVERDAAGLHTVIRGRRHDWPFDTLASAHGLPVASVAALAGYRKAYEAFAPQP